MDDWTALESELDTWQRLGRVATLWWRDDDATHVTPALRELARLSLTYQAPVACAVIPARATRELVCYLGEVHGCKVLQHGYEHKNHAPAGAKRAEYGEHRTVREIVLELKTGFSTMSSLFGKMFLPVLVPPWNRLDDALLPSLEQCGFSGLSTFAPRRSARPVSGLRQTNCHVDLLDWRGSRGFKGRLLVVGELTRHLSARRSETVDSCEPTGLLSHHLNHDAASWRFLEELFERTASHPAVTWLNGARALRS